LSRQVRDLEAEIGMPLLIRDSHHVGLTESGRVFLERARSILDSTDEAVQAARRAAAGEIGRLSVGFIGSLTHEFLPLLLQRYRTANPGIELRLSEIGPARQIDEINAGRLDVGFIGMAETTGESELEIECLFEEPLVASLPADHRFASRKSVSLESLRGDRWLVTARRHDSLEGHWLLAICRALSFEPALLMEVDRAPTVLNYIAAGYGISAFPRQISKLPAPGVVFVAVPPETPKYRYSVAWRRTEASAATVRFLDLARILAKSRQPRVRAVGQKGER
jgi:DNA-binding transcriptional LysR family regulator